MQLGTRFKFLMENCVWRAKHQADGTKAELPYHCWRCTLCVIRKRQESDVLAVERVCPPQNVQLEKFFTTHAQYITEEHRANRCHFFKVLPSHVVETFGDYFQQLGLFQSTVNLKLVIEKAPVDLLN